MEEWLRTFFNGSSELNNWERAVMVLVIIAVAFLVDFVSTRIIVPTVKAITAKTKNIWDDILLSEKVVRAFSGILSPFILLVSLPIALNSDSLFENVMMRLVASYMIIMVIHALCVGVNAFYQLFYEREHVKARSLRGIAQTIKIILWIVGVLLLISVLMDKSPALLITGLGAMATILMLIFQDSIKGLVAGIQLSANDMMQPGDWIKMPKCNADGRVIDVTLNTVKVRNWDNTIITIPPYMLVNDSFQNWKGIVDSNGRRITRSINIDMHSIRFCTAAEIKTYKKNGILNDAFDMQNVTNLQVFRQYMLNYLNKSKDVNHDLMIMIRHLEPGAEGMPLQLYCFANTTVWAEYEDIQSRLMEFMMASLTNFGLLVYQRSSDNGQRLAVNNGF